MRRTAAVARRQARSLFWESVGARYLALAGELVSAAPRRVRQFPRPSYTHLLRLSDDIGVFEHAKLAVPRLEHGYCTDDVARALADKARTGEEVTLEDVSAYGLILPPSHLSTWRIVKYVFQQHNLTFSVTLEAGGWEVIKKYVELGMGVSIVTDICLTGSEKLMRIPLTRYFPQRGYGLVLRKGRPLSPQARRFIEILEERYASAPPAARRGKAGGPGPPRFAAAAWSVVSGRGFQPPRQRR